MSGVSYRGCAELRNTATDELLFLVGRKEVETAQALLGHASPERNVPFPSTREMFLLKGAGDGATAAAYAKAAPEVRRAQLDALAGQGLEGVQPYAHPRGVDSVQWFASAADLCRAMDWLRTKGGPEAAAVLAINDGGAAAERWSYAGYKGGSEPGVLNPTFLLRRKDGHWFSLSATWNNEKEALDDKRFLALVSRALRILACIR